MRTVKVCFLLLIFLVILSFPVKGLAQDSTEGDFPLKFTGFTQAANEDPTLGDINTSGGSTVHKK